MNTAILFVVALDAEARPLVDHYRLRAQRLAGIRLYSHNKVTLAVSGIGSINAAATTAHALSQLPQNTIALNVGIAGSDNPLGQLYFANKICQGSNTTTMASGARALYPPKPFRTALPGITVRSVNTPNTNYSQSIAWDMEAYAFCTIARRYTTAELVHCLKIVSDNAEQPLADASGKPMSHALTAAAVSELIEKQLEGIVGYAQELATLAGHLPAATVTIAKSHGSGKTDRDSIEDGDHSASENDIRMSLEQQLLSRAVQQLHITETQTVQLNDLIQRHLALGISLPDADLIKRASKAGQLIKQLELNLTDKHPVFPLND